MSVTIESLRDRLARVELERDHWIRLFFRLDGAINHHKRDTGDFATDADDRLWLARDKVVKAASR